ncbi:uncharacterized protein LOC110856622 [Folsomia candida]|uniref:uncharacterized protein LOC110856622 n=1 Tax=Folsomia candida TaxID=158441 RepID=UPI000B8F8C9D|nr:uncharacterized protein LOC110856622 [Folsomia candida]
MGSTISIVNETNCILNIALKQVTPLYYENKVMPGQVVKREVGKIWFTVEATLWSGFNDYDDVLKDLSLSTAPKKAFGAFFERTAMFKEISEAATDFMIEHNTLEADEKSEDPIAMRNVLLPPGTSGENQKIVADWITKFVVQEHGVYASADKVIKIVGGPSAVIDLNGGETGEGSQLLENVKPFSIILC